MTDEEIAQRFPLPRLGDMGFGMTQAMAKINRETMERLIKKGLIVMGPRGVGVAGDALYGINFHRTHTYFYRRK